MDILAQKRMLFVLIMGVCVFTGGIARADGRVMGYGFSGIDYFGLRAVDTGRAETFSSDDLWNDVKFLPGGGIEGYRPPQPVLDLLEFPSTETGQRYLEWNRLRLEKIAKAQKVLEDLR